jgi:ABC-2 type transport system permease protein
VIFVETLRRNWKATAGWAASLASLALYVVVAVPDTKALQMYGTLFKDTPKFAMLILGGDAAALASPAGLYGAFFFGWIMLVLATYAVICGLSITANDEDRGILDIMVSMPTPRWRIVVEKFAAYTVNMCVIAFVAFLGIWLSTLNSTVFDLQVGTIFAACLNLVPPMALTMAFTAFVAAIVRRRTVAMGIAGAFVVVSYMLDVVGSQTAGGALSKLSYFNYYNGMMSLVRGPELSSMLFLIVIAIALGAGTVYMFQRRDVGL